MWQGKYFFLRFNFHFHLSVCLYAMCLWVLGIKLVSSGRAESNDNGWVTSLVLNVNFCKTPRERPKANIQDKEGLSLDRKGCSWLENECTLTTTFRKTLCHFVLRLYGHTPLTRRMSLRQRCLGWLPFKPFKVPENGSISHLGWACPSYGRSLWQTLWSNLVWLTASVTQKTNEFVWVKDQALTRKPNQTTDVLCVLAGLSVWGNMTASSSISSASIHFFHECPRYPKQDAHKG